MQAAPPHAHPLPRPSPASSHLPHTHIHAHAHAHAHTHTHTHARTHLPRAQPGSLEGLELEELQALERSLDEAGRSVRAALMERAMAEAQRRRESNDQAQCQVLVRGGAAVEFF
jgi:hypothetical protein